MKEQQRLYFLVFPSKEAAAADDRFADIPKAHPNSYKKHAAAMRLFETTHGVFLVAAVMSLPDHPMKAFKEWEGTLSAGGGIANAFGALDWILGKLKNYLKRQHAASN